MTTPVPPGSIVVGVDGSEYSRHATLWAADQARLEHRPLVLVHAVDTQANLWVGEAGVVNRAGLTEMRERAGVLLRELGAEIRRAGNEVLEVHQVLRSQDPREVLLELSEHAAMVVVGSRGRGPIRSLLLGSVGVAVSQHADCPVVVHRPHGPGSAHERVVVGIASSQPTSSSLEFACRHASLRSLPLTVIHGLWDPVLGFAGTSPMADLDPEPQEESRILTKTLATIAENFPDVEVTAEKAVGIPDDCLIRATYLSAMVVVGRQPQNPMLAMIGGDLSRAVTEHARCVVAVVPESTAGPQALDPELSLEAAGAMLR